MTTATTGCEVTFDAALNLTGLSVSKFSALIGRSEASGFAWRKRDSRMPPDARLLVALVMDAWDSGARYELAELAMAAPFIGSIQTARELRAILIRLPLLESVRVIKNLVSVLVPVVETD